MNEQESTGSPSLFLKLLKDYCNNGLAHAFRRMQVRVLLGQSIVGRARPARWAEGRPARYRITSILYAGVAQLVERVLCNHQVGGSNPSASSTGALSPVSPPLPFCVPPGPVARRYIFLVTA